MAAVGDAEVKGQSGAVYLLNFGVNAMCRIEERDPQQRNYNQIVDEMRTGRPSMRTIRTVVSGALVSPSDQTMEQVGDIIEDIGGVLVVIAAFTQSADDIGNQASASPRPSRRKAR